MVLRSPTRRPRYLCGEKSGAGRGSELAGWVAGSQACGVHCQFRLGLTQVAQNRHWVRGAFSPKFNEKDGHVERGSQNGLHEVGNSGPKNPAGRTGGSWGVGVPNHTVDPIVTRWKKDDKGNKVDHPASERNILQFVAIKRKDCGEWDLPGRRWIRERRSVPH